MSDQAQHISPTQFWESSVSADEKKKHGAPNVATATWFCLACDSLMIITIAQKYYTDKHQNTWLFFVVGFMWVFAIYSTAASPTPRRKTTADSIYKHEIPLVVYILLH